MTNLLIKLFIKDKNVNDKTRGKYVAMGGFTGIVCNLILFLIKLFAGITSASVSIIADAFNNLSDMGSSVITLFGYKLSQKPADKEHPFGHGRLEYTSALAVSFIIIVVGIELFKSGIDKIINPSQLQASTVTIVILVASVLIKGWMYLFNKKIGTISSSAALKATAIDSLSDAVTTLAVLVALIISTATGVNLDPYMTLAVSLFIIYSGIKNAKETLDPLLGMPPEKEMVDEIEQTVLSFEDFIGIHDLVVHNYGPGRTFVSLHVEVPQTVDIIKCHEMVDDCEKLLNERTGAEVVIHMDPIVTDNKQLNQIKDTILNKLKEQNPLYNLHDFRMVDGKEHINLVFDVVAPIDENKDDSAVKEMVRDICKNLDRRYNAVVTVDRDYVGRK